MVYQISYDIDEKYNIIRQLGNGSFGAVYFVHNKILNKDRAIKVIATTDKNTFQEAQIGNIITHSNLVKIHSAEYNQEKQHLIIEMDFCKNGSLENKLNSAGFISLKLALRYAVDILRGLEALHGVSIFHNDIKPKNILIGDDDHAILTDYGIAMMSEDKRPINPLKGFYKLHFAPETFNTGCINVSTDIYQVGLTLFRIINGVNILPNKYNSLGESTYAKLIKDGKLISNDDFLCFIPRQIKTIINKATSADINKRYKTAREMRHAIEQLVIKGDWTLGSNGNFLGEDSNYYYTYHTDIKQNLYSFNAYKENKMSHKKTQIHKYNGKQLTKTNLNKLLKQFMQDVVLGNT